MIQSKIINEDEVKQPAFPCLMINEFVVALFYSKKEGIVIHRLNDNAALIGCLVFNSPSFTIFNGVVELQNNT